MKHKILILLLLYCVHGFTQYPCESGLTRLAERVRLFGERIPQEKVFVQMDNTCYFLGDTIWFSAFTRRTNSGRPSRISRVLYAELWNHDGFLVERKLVEMRDGRGSGFFALPDTLYSGYFELRAYTRWQLNWGESLFAHARKRESWFFKRELEKDFYRDYEKLYSRVFPVYDKPKQEGEYNRDMTLRPLRRYFKSDPEPPKLLLSLFPEGGNLVAGMPCRVAFEAALEDGEYKEGSLTLTLSQGEGIVVAKTENRGRGTFTFTPEEGKSYEVVFTSSDGKTARQKMKDIEKEGVSLQVSQQGDQWVFDIHTNLDKPLGMTIMHEGVVQRYEDLSPSLSSREGASHSLILSFSQSQLKSGINQVTIFDEEGRVWADRLFFVTKPELTQPTISISGLKDEYQPYELITLDVKCQEENVNTPLLNREGPGVSLAVRDAVRQDNTFDSGNIMTEMLLASEIKGFVPQPEWFFERDDEEHRRGLDLLLMTQGWRRFAWQDMAIEGRWEITHPAELSQILYGNVYKYYSDNTYKIAYNIPDTIRSVEGMRLETQPWILRKDRNGKAREDYSDIGEAWRLDDIIARDTKTVLGGRDYQNSANLKRDVRVHAEFIKPEAMLGNKTYVSETDTQKGQFKIDTPNFTGDCIMFLSASDTTKWSSKAHKRHNSGKSSRHIWVQVEDDDYNRLHEEPEFYVRIAFPFPRWPKVYTHYQTNANGNLTPESINPASFTNEMFLNEVTIRSKHGGRRSIDLSKPAYVIDAYEAANAAMDAGLMNSLQVNDSLKGETRYLEYLINYTYAIARNYIGDMGGLSRDFDFDLYLDSTKVAEVRPQYITNLDKDKFNPVENHYITVDFSSSLDDVRRYARLEYQDKIYLYTDYSPRRNGDERFKHSNQPSVAVRLTHYPNWERRVTYRDRRYILQGFAYQEDFYHPDYKRNPPKEGQKDYRRTLYWNPDLKLDKNGEAHVTLYNNSQKTQIKVEANGLTSEGGFLYNK